MVGALRPLLPEVADLLPAELPALNDRAAERHRIFRALVEVCGCLGEATLVLEDLHWADEQTVEFLAYLLAEPLLSLSGGADVSRRGDRPTGPRRDREAG